MRWKKGQVPWNKGIKQWANKIHPRIGKHHTEATKILIGTKAHNRISKIKGRKFTKEHINNMVKSRIEKGTFAGCKNPNWKGGITKLEIQIRETKDYENWRNLIFKRDEYKCKKCGLNKNKLNVHHKISFKEIILKNNIKTVKEAINCKELWDINNGETLCLECHKETDSFLKNGNYYKYKTKCQN